MERTMTELEVLKAELQWALENNGDRPRTEAAIIWALEALEGADCPSHVSTERFEDAIGMTFKALFVIAKHIGPNCTSQVRRAIGLEAPA
ncbi:hypothetical protein BZM27_05755 [Paraburkholderia steynii]|uniref:Uncharacterized protein n=1 Tax=Paraburkholderia steynii TaxID=1245441 RepID=A0A4R0XKA1_9BURK|nr:hypothetical protein BZM27_05755 [Paraburkholderia steynii]